MGFDQPLPSQCRYLIHYSNERRLLKTNQKSQHKKERQSSSSYLSKFTKNNANFLKKRNLLFFCFIVLINFLINFNKNL